VALVARSVADSIQPAGLAGGTPRHAGGGPWHGSSNRVTAAAPFWCMGFCARPNRGVGRSRARADVARSRRADGPGPPWLATGVPATGVWGFWLATRRIWSSAPAGPGLRLSSASTRPVACGRPVPVGSGQVQGVLPDDQVHGVFVHAHRSPRHLRPDAGGCGVIPGRLRWCMGSRSKSWNGPARQAVSAAGWSGAWGFCCWCPFGHPRAGGRDDFWSRMKAMNGDERDDVCRVAASCVGTSRRGRRRSWVSEHPFHRCSSLSSGFRTAGCPRGMGLGARRRQGTGFRSGVQGPGTAMGTAVSSGVSFGVGTRWTEEQTRGLERGCARPVG